MPKNIKNVKEKLFGMLFTNGYDPIPKSLDTNSTPDISEADVFQITTKNGYPMTVTIDDTSTLKVYYDEENGVGSDWTQPNGLSHLLMSFVRRHNLTDYDPEPQGMKKLKYDSALRSYRKKEEDTPLNEGYHAMGKRASYNDSIPTVKIVIQHNRQLGEGEQRFRNVEKIFIENVDGERYRSPTNSPGLSKVFGRCIAEGDKPHSEHWNHLVSLVEDYTKLRGFVRATKNGIFSENAQRMIEVGAQKYSELRETIRSLMTSRGYRNYFENWKPSLIEGLDDGVDLSEMFKSVVVDSRIAAALPVIKRFGGGLTEQQDHTSSLAEWAGQVERDAVYGVEDRAEDKLDEGCDCGPDCDCPDCQEHNPKSKKDVEEAKSPQEFMAFIGKPNRDVLGNERADIHLTPYQWELYTASPELAKQVKKTAEVLNREFNNLVNDPNATREFVKSGMEFVMARHDKSGANDTEPHAVLSHLLDKYFPEDDTMAEADLSPKQKKLDKNRNNRLDAQDFKMLRTGKTNEDYGGGTKPYGRGIKRGDFVKIKGSGDTLYRVFAMDGANYVVKPYEGNNNYGDEVEFKEHELTRVERPTNADDMMKEGELTPGQKRAGQVGATERAKSIKGHIGKPNQPHPFQDRLVGASESADPLAAIRRLSGVKK